MSRTIMMLAFALVLLGFLASTTLNMYYDIETLRTENQKLSEALSRLSAEHKVITEERDMLRGQNEELLKKTEMLQQAYTTENQARFKAESDVAILQAMLNNMMQETQVTSPLADPQTEQQFMKSERDSFATVIPFGTGFVTILVGMIAINRHRVNKNLHKMPKQVRSFPQSIPRR